MIAFEAKGIVDNEGFLQVKKPIALRNRKVRVLVLLQEEENDNAEWLKAVSANPAFAFLDDEAEDIYSLNDGFDLTDER